MLEYLRELLDTAVDRVAASDLAQSLFTDFVDCQLPSDVPAMEEPAEVRLAHAMKNRDCYTMKILLHVMRTLPPEIGPPVSVPNEHWLTYNDPCEDPLIEQSWTQVSLLSGGITRDALAKEMYMVWDDELRRVANTTAGSDFGQRVRNLISTRLDTLRWASEWTSPSAQTDPTQDQQ